MSPARRSPPPSRGGSAARQEIDRSLALVFDLSPEQHRRAVLDGQFRLRVDRLVRRLETTETERAELQRRLASGRKELAALDQQARRSPERSRALTARLAAVDEELERLGQELVWQSWRLRHERSREARSQPGEDGRSDFDREYDLVGGSELFDREWYLARYTDIAEARMDPLLHYVRYAAEEGRDPGPEFSSRAYVLDHPDLGGVNPLAHFLESATSEPSGPPPAGADRAPELPPPATRRRRSLVPRLASEDEYLAAVRQPEPFLPAALAVCRREGIEPARSLEHVSIDSSFPAFVAPPDHVIKLYSRWRNGPATLERELVALRVMARDPSLPVPRLVAHGSLVRGWQYVVMTRVPGVRLVDVGDWLDAEEMHRVAAWMGDFIRRLHAIELTAEERQAGLPRFRQWLEGKLSTVRERMAATAALPAHLLAQLDEWMPTATELMRASDRAVLVHREMLPAHVLGHFREGRFHPTGIIDFNSAYVGHPLCDIGRAWWCGLDGDRDLFETYLSEARPSEAQLPDFPRLALAWALVAACAVPPRLVGIEDIASLDELAARSFGAG